MQNHRSGDKSMQDTSQEDIDIQTLKYYRDKKRNLTQRQLADKVGVDLSTVYKWEIGKHGVSKKHKPILAEVLGVPLEKLKQPPPENDEGLENKTLDRLPEKTKVAMTIVADTYHVNPADIRDLAPYLFHILAGASLETRKQKVNEVLSNLSEIQRCTQEAMPHIPHALLMGVDNFRDEEVSEELEAINNQQLFDVFFEYENDKNQMTNNPFTNFLRDFEKQVPEMLNNLFEVDWVNDDLPMARLSEAYLSELTQLPVDTKLFDEVRDLILCGKLSHTYFHKFKGMEKFIADNIDDYMKEINQTLREASTIQSSSHSGVKE